MHARRLGGAIVAGLLVGAVAEAQTPPPVTLPGTQVLNIHSSVTGQDYTLQVALPRGYEDPSSSFPVIYALDGQWDFTLVHNIYGQQYYDGFLPAAIVVGITWGGEKPDYDARRAFDLTPTAIGQAGRYGNAAGFLSFIQKEAIPFVESHFRTKKSERTLTGSSFGGLFTLYALFHQPGLFEHYVLTSPAWTWDQNVLLTDGQVFAKGKLTRPVKLFMGIGEYEDVAAFEKLAATIRGYRVEGLELETKVIGGAGHSGGKAEGYTRGLQYVFARPCLTLDAAALQRLAGDYEIGPGTTVKVAVEGSALVAYAPGGQRLRPCAVGPLEFRTIGNYDRVRFTEGQDKAITGFVLEQYSGTLTAKRLPK
jgi:predicted alpha/beta superfamily hydrolase